MPQPEDTALKQRFAAGLFSLDQRDNELTALFYLELRELSVHFNKEPSLPLGDKRCRKPHFGTFVTTSSMRGFYCLSELRQVCLLGMGRLTDMYRYMDTHGHQFNTAHLLQSRTHTVLA